MSEPSPASPDESPEPWGWTRAHRIGLGILVFLFIVFLFIQFLRRPIRMHDPLIVTESQPATLATRIDPNTASAAELSRIPHIGPKLAEAIVKYRDSRKSMAPGGIVFGRVEDLDRVTGIGKALVAQLRPFLDFPEPASEPDSQPASK